METWRCTFERHNYGYSPPLHQLSDVVFQTDIPFDDEHIEAFEEAAWNAMREQNPHFGNPAGPLPERSGWSSVCGGSKFTRA